MLKLKYFFGKAWFIAVMLGCLRYLTIGFNVGWDIFSESWSLESNSGISRDVATSAKQLLKMSAIFLWLDPVFTSSTSVIVLLDFDLSENIGLTVFQNFLLSAISLTSRLLWYSFLLFLIRVTQ